MGKIVKYEVVQPHYCEACGEMIGQTTKTRAWIRKSFVACRICDRDAAALLLKCYQDGLDVVYLEGVNP